MDGDRKHALPVSPFVCDTAPADTMMHCAHVIAFIAEAIPAMEIASLPLHEDTAHGVSWILEGVAQALRFEASGRKEVGRAHE